MVIDELPKILTYDPMVNVSAVYAEEELQVDRV